MKGTKGVAFSHVGGVNLIKSQTKYKTVKTLGVTTDEDKNQHRLTNITFR